MEFNRVNPQKLVTGSQQYLQPRNLKKSNLPAGRIRNQLIQKGINPVSISNNNPAVIKLSHKQTILQTATKCRLIEIDQLIIFEHR
jgi:hypothetical protein